jgi:PAS domain S-box-containing protein
LDKKLDYSSPEINSYVLEQITKSIGAGIAIISKDYKTLWANEVIKNIFGNDVEGKCCFETYNKRGDICPDCVVRKVFETGAKSAVHEQSGKDADGNLIWSQIIATPIYNGSGEIESAIEVVVDITERKKDEEDLRNRSQGFKSLLETSKKLAEKLDLQNVLQVSVDCATKLVSLDTSAVYLLEDEMLHLWATTPPLPSQFPDAMRYAPLADHPHIKEAIKSQRHILISDYLKAELSPAEQAIAKERNLRTLLFVPLVLDDKSLGVFIVGSIEKPSTLTDFEIGLCHTLASLASLTVRNSQLYSESRKNEAKLEQMLTDRIQLEKEKNKLEAQLQNAQKLESIGILAGGIAHDFNNILVAILGNIDLSLYDSNLSPKTQKLLIEAKKASLRAKDLTQQLLTFSKGGQPIKEVTSLVELVKESAEINLHGNTNTCKYDFSDDLWLVEIDKGQISQVVQNFVLNASQSMPDGGTIEISCEKYIHDESKLPLELETGCYLKLSIKDSGVGIPTNILGKIFDPYFSTKQKGNGLGLAISYSIIKKHGGIIKVESTPMVGSTFTVFLPAIENYSLNNDEETITDFDHPMTRIMVMDDEEQVRNICLAMLKSMGHEALLAKNGSDALTLYKQAMDDGRPIDLIIMDLTVPGGMGGKETIKEILTLNPEAKVIVSSGYATNPIMSNYQEYGFCGTLTKPFKLKDLTKALNEAFTHLKHST